MYSTRQYARILAVLVICMIELPMPAGRFAHANQAAPNETFFATRANRGDDSGYACRDTFWKASTRHMPGPCGGLPTELPTLRQKVNGRWVSSSWEEFLESPADMTFIYVHGNRIEASQAGQRGQFVYSRVRRACPSSSKWKTLTWSWPSAPVRGLVRDARVKASRAVAESIHLANVLHKIPGDEKVSIVGFSLGATVISGASHMLAGGQVKGISLPDSDRPVIQPRVVFMSAALFVGRLHPQGSFRRALPQMSELTLVNNSRDPILRRLFLVTGSKQQRALGEVGLPRHYATTPTRQRDFNFLLKRSHSWRSHIESGRIMQFVRQGITWPEQDPASPAQEVLQAPTEARPERIDAERIDAERIDNRERINTARVGP